MNEIAEKLNVLEENNKIDFQELQNNEQFIDVVIQATTLALKTSEREKIKAFQNAVLNTASGDSPDKTIRQIFLNQLDGFTTLHFKILKFIDSPRLWFQNAKMTTPECRGGSISSVIQEAFPELIKQDELLDLIWNDLHKAGFHKTSGIKTIMTGDSVLSERTTSFGKQFIKFITNDRT